MKGRSKDSQHRTGRYRRANLVILCMLLVVALGVVGFNLTEAKVQKAQKTNSKSEDVKVENKGSTEMDKNPLTQETDPKLAEVINDYYVRLPEHADFVESYDNVRIYTKLGKYKGSYVAFVRYDMKIKDVYTKLPGLGTLYAEKSKENGRYHVTPTVEDDKLKDYIRTVAGHEDVKTLMSGTETDYHKAVESDALLKEALADLKNAYEDSTGTGSNNKG